MGAKIGYSWKMALKSVFKQVGDSDNLYVWVASIILHIAPQPRFPQPISPTFILSDPFAWAKLNLGSETAIDASVEFLRNWRLFIIWLFVKLRFVNDKSLSKYLP